MCNLLVLDLGYLRMSVQRSSNWMQVWGLQIHGSHIPGFNYLQIGSVPLPGPPCTPSLLPSPLEELLSKAKAIPAFLQSEFRRRKNVTSSSMEKPEVMFLMSFKALGALEKNFSPIWTKFELSRWQGWTEAPSDGHSHWFWMGATGTIVSMVLAIWRYCRSRMKPLSIRGHVCILFSCCS